MMENQQLIKKDRSANSYSKIFPWTFTDLVLDRVTKESLDNILVRNNFIALPYVGSKAATRLQVPMKNRRRGIWLSYIDYAGTLTVEYYNDNNLDDNHWQDSSYWLPYNTAEFQPASVGLSALAQEVFDWINSQITTAVELNPEDLQKNSSGQIEEANRAYDTSTFSGLGYRILRKNIQSNKNVLTQSMINMPNNVYNIRYDFDLNGATINLPENSILKFEGGSINRGTINGNNTKIVGPLTQIFKNNITISGTWNVSEVYPEWFGAKGDGVTDDTISLQTCINYFNVIKLSNRTYITNMLNIPSFKNIIGEGKNSIIKANPSMELTNNYLIRTKDGGSGIRISNLKIICGNTSNEADYKIGGIGLISTANANNDQWDTRNIIENVEILNCYAASIYIGTYQRENKIQNCFISNTTNNGINCQGTDNMINGCTIAGSHLSGIMLQGNNRLSNTKLFGCCKSKVTKNLYALDIFGSKCNVSNIELQQNYYGGVIVRGNSNYVQVTNDNNGSGNTAGTSTGVSIVGSYNTIIVTSYNFSFHDDAYERYFVSTNWNTTGNNIIVNGTPLKNNKMSALSPWSVDNICNNINWNGYNLTQNREVSFDKLVIPNKYRTNGTGSFYTNETGLSFKITSVTAIGNDALSYSIPIYNSNKIDPDGCFSIKARFHKNGDTDDAIYPVIRINTYYKNSAEKTVTRTDQSTIINLLDNKDSLDVYALASYHYLSDKAVSISSVSVELVVRSTKILSDVSIDAYFDDIKIGATTSGDTVKFINSNVDGTNGSKVVIANEMSDFTLENVIYKIISNIDLGTSELVIPANCTLDFQGGSFSNGTITFSNTTIVANSSNYIFKNIIFKGSLKCSDFYVDWVGASASNEDNSDFIKQAVIVSSTFRVPIVFNSVIYNITKPIILDTLINNVTIKGNKARIQKVNSITTDITEAVPTYGGNVNINYACIFCITEGHYWTIRDLAFYGGTTEAYNNYGIFIIKGSNFLIENVGFTYCSIAMYVFGLWMSNFTKITCTDVNIGFNFNSARLNDIVGNSGTSICFNNCYVNRCNTGFNLKWLNYSVLNSCAVDYATTNAYTYADKSCVTMNGCGSEASKSWINLLSNSNVVLNACQFLSTTAENTSTVVLFNSKILFNNCAFQDYVTKAIFTNKESNITLIDTDVSITDTTLVFSISGVYYIKLKNKVYIITYNGKRIENIIDYSNLLKGTTDNRPILASINEGFEYYDSTLKKKILWNGSTWTNLDGTALT